MVNDLAIAQAQLGSPGPDARRTNNRRWWGLIVIALAQLMVVLDATIVNVALPTIQRDLSVSDADRQWIVTAYTLAFGGLLLLGGRISDYTGRKRAFMIGLVGFATASAIGGASVNLGMLLAARAGQGAFGALLAPSALALLTTTFSDQRERGTAFAVFGAVAGGGAAVGLVLGGVLTEYLNWGWVLYVNVPVAAIAFVGGFFLLSESRLAQRPRFDVLGAILATGGLVSLVYGFNEAATHGWDATRTLALLLGAGVLLVIFVVVERFVADPLLPLGLIANRGRGGSALAVILAAVGLFGMFFFLSFYLQRVLGYSPVRTGVAFLPMTAGVLLTSVIASRIMARVPPRLLVGLGLLLAAAGMAWLIRLEVDSGYAADVLPALITVGLGLGLVFPTTANLATNGVQDRESGVASATFNTSQQVGASLGTALLNTIAANRTADYLASHQPGPATQIVAVVEGDVRAVTWAAAILAGAGVLALMLINARFATTSDVAASSVNLPVDPAPPGDRGSVGRHSMSGGADSPGPAVHGTVRRTDGGEIAEAVLTLVRIGGNQVGDAARSGPDGQYLVGTPGPGEYLLIAAAGAYQPAVRTLVVDSETITVDLKLQGSASLWGVVASSDGDPVGQAAVTVADLRGHVVTNTLTDDDGRYQLPELASGTYTIVVAATGFRPLAQAISFSSTDDCRFDVVLSGSTVVEGTVRSAVSRRPVTEARVTLLDSAGSVVAVVDTDENGFYSIRDLGSGEYTLVAMGFPSTAADLTIVGGRDVRRDVDLGYLPNASIAGADSAEAG